RVQSASVRTWQQNPGGRSHPHMGQPPSDSERAAGLQYDAGRPLKGVFPRLAAAVARMRRRALRAAMSTFAVAVVALRTRTVGALLALAVSMPVSVAMTVPVAMVVAPGCMTPAGRRGHEGDAGERRAVLAAAAVGIAMRVVRTLLAALGPVLVR